MGRQSGPGANRRLPSPSWPGAGGGKLNGLVAG